MIRRLRLVLPPSWVLGLFAFGYLLLEAIHLVVTRFNFVEEGVAQLRDKLVLLACLLYGGFRVVAFHPLFQPAYRQWLATTPWTSRQPLPLAPVHIVWQDVVVLIVAELLFWAVTFGWEISLASPFASPAVMAASRRKVSKMLPTETPIPPKDFCAGRLTFRFPALLLEVTVLTPAD